MVTAIHGDSAYPCHLSLTQSSAIATLTLSNALAPAPAAKHTTYGLTGMHERLETVGGLLEAGIQDGAWVLRVIVATGLPLTMDTVGSAGSR